MNIIVTWLKHLDVIPNIDRPLTNIERQSQLSQKKKLNVTPHDFGAMIAINSTYLESVDIYYGWKGALTSSGMSIGALVILFLVKMIQDVTHDSNKMFSRDPQLTKIMVSLASLFFIAIIIICVFMFFFESFRRTHYPIRFDRKNRMVHVFRRKGTILSAPWDDLFFTLSPARSEGSDLTIKAHVMKEDMVTVKESFLLGCRSSEAQNMFSFWEYIRRFMEEGPNELNKQSDFFLPIGDRREPPWFGLWRLLLNLNGLLFMQIILSPIFIVFALGRVIATWTSRIPKWPKEIVDMCAPETNDPYARDWRTNSRHYLLFFGSKTSKT
jgi:hypothetical protein